MAEAVATALNKGSRWMEREGEEDHSPMEEVPQNHQSIKDPN